MSFQYSETNVPTPGQGWTSAEREIAVRLKQRGQTHKGISAALKEQGYERTPKAIERFFHRLGDLPEAPDDGAEVLEDGSVIQPYKPIKTTWGAPMLTPRLRLEFGQASELVPVAIIPDIHAPFHDPLAVQLACDVVERVKPAALVYLGDNVDWVQLSRFNKDPHRITMTAHEVAEWHKIDRMFQKAAGSECRRYYLLGNHEKRLRAYHCSHPELVGFPGMQFDAILGLDSDFKPLHNLQLVEEEIVWRDRFIFKHGDMVRKWACYSAKAELEKNNVSGISGHTHRIADYSVTNRGRTTAWWEAGCLCSMTPDYMHHPNWQQGMAIGWFNADGSSDYFHIDLIKFVNHQAIVNGVKLSRKG